MKKMKKLYIKIAIVILSIIIILSGNTISQSTKIDTNKKNKNISNFDNSDLVGQNYIQTEQNSLIRDEICYPLDDNFFNNLAFKETVSEKIDYVPGEFIVKFKKDTNFKIISTSDNNPKIDFPSIELLSKKNNVLKIENINKKQNSNTFGLSNIYKFTVSKDCDILSIVDDYTKDPNVEYAQANHIYKICSIPNDPYFNNQWSLNQANNFDINAPEAWDLETGSKNVTIAIIDTGIDYNHPDLVDNIWINKDEIIDGNDTDENGFIDDIRGWNFSGNNSDIIDNYGHGTHCAGIASASTNNGIGIAGICWNSKIMPIKISDIGYIKESDAASGIIYATDNGADVISMSFGGGKNTQLLKDAVDYAHSKNVVLVSSAGNLNMDMKFYPAAYENVISVAASDEIGRRAYFSNYGNWVDIVAPGINIFSTIPTIDCKLTKEYGLNKNYDSLSGTSMACPHVSGLAALILSKNNSLNNNRVRNIIINSCNRLHPLIRTGKGRIDANKAIKMGNNDVTAHITNPIDFDEILTSKKIDIVGNASGKEFQYYTLEYTRCIDSEDIEWIEIKNSSSKIHDQILCKLDTTHLSEGLYLIRLIVNCVDEFFIDTVFILIHKEPNTFIVDDGILSCNDFHSIQEVVYHCGEGDTVYVKEGKYKETIEIHKSINLIGENKSKVQIESFRKMYTIKICTDGVEISGFTLKNNFLRHFNKIFSGLISYEVSCIDLENINNSKIFKNIIQTDNKDSAGIKLSKSFNNSFCKNMIKISNSSMGFYLYKSLDNTFIENYLINRQDKIDIGALFYNSSSNNIYKNYFSWIDLYLYYCNNNILGDNKFYNCSVWIDGDKLTHFEHTICQDNVVNNRKLYYFFNEKEVTTPLNPGQIILVNCSNCKITGLKFKNFNGSKIDVFFSNNITISDNEISTGSIMLYYSKDNLILNNTLSNMMGIYVIKNNNTIIENNIIKDSIYGINIIDSNDSMISENSIQNIEYFNIAVFKSSNYIINDNNLSNSNIGVYISFYSNKGSISKNIIFNCLYAMNLNYIKNNDIIENNIFNNTYGINITGYGKNEIYHNNFKSNLKNAFDSLNQNKWYNVSLSEGNYWDDYEGLDVNLDGIGDSSYDISGADNKDLYPLIDPWNGSEINNAPNQPNIPDGPTNGLVKISYEYSFFAVDPEKENISYYIDWGDGDTTGWIEYQKSGKSIKLYHNWSSNGNYDLRVKAKDVNNQESIWSKKLTVNISESEEETELEIDINKGFSIRTIKASVSNTGGNSADDIDFNLSIRSIYNRFRFFEIKKEKNVSVSLDRNESCDIEINPLKGFGRINVTAKADCDNAKTVKKTVTGLILRGIIFLPKNFFD